MALDRPPPGLPAALARYLYSVRNEINALTSSGTTKPRSTQAITIDRTVGVAAAAGASVSASPAATALYNLQVFGGLEMNLLTWQGINQAGYDHTEIWSNNRDELSSAKYVDTAIVGVYADAIGENQSRYYWVRAVNKDGKAGPFNRQAGTFGATSVGTEYILDQLSGAITESQLYADLQAKIDDSYTGVTTNTVAIAGLDAQYTVKVDVDGYVSGFGLANTLKNGAPFSEFIILADAFAVVFPAQTWSAGAGAALGEYIKPTALPTGLYYKVITPGTLGASEPTWPTIAGDTVTSGTALLQAVTIESSIPFIVGQVGGVSTVGVDGSLVVDGTITADSIAAGTITADKLSVADLAAVSATLGTVTGGTFQTGLDPAMRTEISSSGAYLIWAGSGTTGGAGSIFYIDTSGNAYFKGTLDAGVISGSTINPGGLLIDCGGGRTTTFVISSVDNKTFFRAKKGSAGAVTLDLGTYYGPAHGTGYYSGRFAWQQMDVFIDYALNGDWGAVTTKIDVQYDAGAWENIYSFETDCDYRGGANGSLIYTTKDTAWGTMAVRVTTDGNTQSASGRVVVINLAQSTQTPDTVHNTTGDTSDPGVTRTLDDVTQGTSYHKSSSTYVDTAGKHVALYDTVNGLLRDGGYVGEASRRAQAGIDSSLRILNLYGKDASVVKDQSDTWLDNRITGSVTLSTTVGGWFIAVSNQAFGGAGGYEVELSSPNTTNGVPTTFRIAVHVDWSQRTQLKILSGSGGLNATVQSVAVVSDASNHTFLLVYAPTLASATATLSARVIYHPNIPTALTSPFTALSGGDASTVPAGYGYTVQGYIDLTTMPSDAVSTDPDTQIYTATKGGAKGVRSALAQAGTTTDPVLMIDHPGGGSYSYRGSSVSGAIRILMPVGYTSTMLNFDIDIFNYATNKYITVHVSGYNYGTTGAWQNCTAHIIGDVTQAYKVRFGSSGGKVAIWIGETSTIWAYPRIIVKNFHAGFNNATAGNWANGWSIGLVATLGTIDQVITYTLPSSGTEQSGSGKKLGGTDNVGANNITFSNMKGDTSSDTSTSLIDGANKRWLHDTMSTGVQAVIDSSGTADVSKARSGTILPGANNGLAIAGSGQRNADARNLPMEQVGNAGMILSAVPCTPTWTGTQWRLDANTHTAYYGSGNVSYTGTTGVLTGALNSTPYYLYADDPNYSGGAVTWHFTTSKTTATASGRYQPGSVTTGSGTGSGGGSGGACVAVSAFLNFKGLRALLARKWMFFRVRGFPWFWPITKEVKYSRQPCVVMITEKGASLTLSKSTPFDLRNGGQKLAPDMYGEYVLVRRHWWLPAQWECVTHILDAGYRRVALISFGGRSYFAGSTRNALICSHNSSKF